MNLSTLIRWGSGHVDWTESACNGYDINPQAKNPGLLLGTVGRYLADRSRFCWGRHPQRRQRFTDRRVRQQGFDSIVGGC